MPKEDELVENLPCRPLEVHTGSQRWRIRGRIFLGLRDQAARPEESGGPPLGESYFSARKLLVTEKTPETPFADM